MGVTIILAQMLMLFAMMLVGYFIWKRKWFDEAAYQKLSKIVVNILNPLLAIYGVAGKDSEGNADLLLQNLGFVVAFYVLLIVVSFLLAALLHPLGAERKLYRLMCIFPNAAFMGIPVITSIFGSGSMIYIVFYVLGYNLLLYTYGVALAKKAARDVNAEETKDGKGQWKRMLGPGVIASVAAMVIFLLKLPLPAPVESFCDYMGNATIPMSMLLIGMSIAKADLKKIFVNKRMYAFVALRMLLLPIGTALLLKPFGADATVLGVFVLQLSMPVGSMVTLIAKENGADEAVCTNGIVLTTLASILTIPVVCMFL